MLAACVFAHLKNLPDVSVVLQTGASTVQQTMNDVNSCMTRTVMTGCVTDRGYGKLPKLVICTSGRRHCLSLECTTQNAQHTYQVLWIPVRGSLGLHGGALKCVLSALQGSLRLVNTVSAAVRGPRQSERLGTDGAAGYGAERLGSRSLKACAVKACAVTKHDGQVVGSILPHFALSAVVA